MRAGGLIRDPSSPEAEVTRGRLWNGGDVTPGRSFGFRSKEYAGHHDGLRRHVDGHRAGLSGRCGGDLVRASSTRVSSWS